MFDRRQFLGAAGAALASPLLARRASAQEFTLKFQGDWSTHSVAQKAMMERWASRLREDSDGRIRIEIDKLTPHGVADPRLGIRQVLSSHADIAWMENGYTAERLARTQVFELPDVYDGNVIAANLAMREMFDEYLAPDYDGVHVITLHVHAGQGIHMRETPVRSPADLAGKRMRVPTQTSAWIAEAFGATPVITTVGDIPRALSTGLVDGCFLPWEIIPVLNLQSLTEYQIEGHEHERFGTATFQMSMSQRSWESLPPDLQEVVNKNSGEAFAREAGQVWRNAEESGIKDALDAGNELITLTEEEMLPFREAMEPVHQRWLEDVAAQGIDGQALHDAAKASIARHSSRTR
jgi:TRAP-type C4-dicarboxylate transport system substrate-binding protein